MSSQTALIIGASRGLGLGLAREYLDRGWHVIGTVRGTMRTALHDLEDRHADRLTIETVDINEPAQVEALHGRLAVGKSICCSSMPGYRTGLARRSARRAT